MESLDEVEAWLRYRLARHGRSAKVLIDRPTGAQAVIIPYVRARIWTTTNLYSIVARHGAVVPRERKSYLGCVVSTRAPRPGEDHTRGSDLADGDLGDETLNAILADIVHYEALDIAKPRAEVPVGEFLPGRPVTLMPRKGPLTNADEFTRDPHPTKHILDRSASESVKITTAGKEVGTCDRCGKPTSLGHLGGFRCGDCLASS